MLYCCPTLLGMSHRLSVDWHANRYARVAQSGCGFVARPARRSIRLGARPLEAYRDNTAAAFDVSSTGRRALKAMTGPRRGKAKHQAGHMQVNFSAMFII
jgi:hypothetical protein